MTPYKIRPEDSPIINACYYRDFERVRGLVDKGGASPFDITLQDVTHLHVSSFPTSVRERALMR